MIRLKKKQKNQLLVVTKDNKNIRIPDKLDLDIDFVDINLSKLFKVI